MLEIYKGDADLSRQAVRYELHRLSFREYLGIEKVMELPIYSLNEILANHSNIASEITAKVKILPLFKAYLEHGYYPFYRESVKNYASKLQNVINTVIENDLPAIEKIDYSGLYSIKKLLMILSSLVPYTPNIEQLSNEMKLNRASTLKYLRLLNHAQLINELLPDNKGMCLLIKSEKIYLNNSNLLYALTSSQVEEGNVRETFFVNQLQVLNRVLIHHSKKPEGNFIAKATFYSINSNEAIAHIFNLFKPFVFTPNFKAIFRVYHKISCGRTRNNVFYF